MGKDSKVLVRENSMAVRANTLLLTFMNLRRTTDDEDPHKIKAPEKAS